jgi:hypothetical protein
MCPTFIDARDHTLNFRNDPSFHPTAVVGDTKGLIAARISVGVHVGPSSTRWEEQTVLRINDDTSTKVERDGKTPVFVGFVSSQLCPADEFEICLVCDRTTCVVSNHVG